MTPKDQPMETVTDESLANLLKVAEGVRVDENDYRREIAILVRAEQRRRASPSREDDVEGWKKDASYFRQITAMKGYTVRIAKITGERYGRLLLEYVAEDLARGLDFLRADGYDSAMQEPIHE